MMLRLTYQSGKRVNDWSQSAILGDRGIAARNFADLVAARLIGTVLPFSERESLVRAAARHGINRFEANLLIAAVQYQMGVGRQRAEKRGLRAFATSALRGFVTLQTKMLAAIQRQWRVIRQWAIEKQLLPSFRVPLALTTFWMSIAATVQRQWELTREWAIAKRVWPKFIFSPVMEMSPASNHAVMRDRPGVVRRRLPKRETAGMRISSALATFLAVQAGIVAAVWYLFSY
jgi:hypothetical protein